MKLPANAQIAPEKLTRYLLVRRPAGDKSEFLKQAAYTLDNPEPLEEDIRRQILTLDAVSVEKTNYGELFEIQGHLRDPTRGY